jgi:hypothetical protein
MRNEGLKRVKCDISKLDVRSIIQPRAMALPYFTSRIAFRLKLYSNQHLISFNRPAYVRNDKWDT